MRYFKKFADFCSGLAAFSGAVSLLLRYLKFDPKNVEEELGLIDKLKLYFSKTDNVDNFLMLLLVAFFALSVAVACILPRLPSVSFFFTVLPLALSIDMVAAGRIKSSPMLYVILAVIASVGTLYECLRRDKETGGRQGAVANFLACAFVSAFSFFIWCKQRSVSLLDTKESLELNFFDYEIYSNLENANAKVLLIFTIMYAVIALILIVFGNIYFIGPCLTAMPAAASIYLWNTERISAHAEVIVTLAVAAFVTSLVCMLLGVATPRRSRRRL